MKFSVLLLAAALLAVVVSAQTYCPGGPSLTSDSNIMLLEGPGFPSYSPGCPGKAGVDDQTSRVAGISAGSSITVTFGTCDSSYNNAAELWIDFNRDGTFQPSESMGTWSGNTNPQAVHSFPITIPSDFSGSTRARVMMQETGAIPLDPCAQYSWGAVIDFTVSTKGGGGGGGGGKKGGLSGGSILLIIVLVVSVVYVVGGCVYMRKKKGTTGMIESCPNNGFWCMIPGLTKDGCIFTNRRCLQPCIAKVTGKSSRASGADYEEL